MEKMSDHVKKWTVDPEKAMEMLGPSMKAGQQIMESVLQGMGSAMDAASRMDQDSKKKKTAPEWRVQISGSNLMDLKDGQMNPNCIFLEWHDLFSLIKL